MYQLITQGVGYLALICVIVSFQKDKRGTMLYAMLAGVVLFAIHYTLLRAWTGLAMNLIEAGVVYVAYKQDTERWAKQPYWPYLFIVLFIVAGFATSKSLIAALPVVAQILGTIAVWQKHPRAIRFIMLAPRPLWFVYNLAVGSQAGMVTEVVILLSVLVGILRFDVIRWQTKRN